MHIASCLNPKLIRHPYTHEQMYVPCGHCAACLRARSMRWVERLNQERYSWKYCIFFTLTYDNEHVPLLRRVNDTLVDIHHRLTPPEKEVVVIDINEAAFKYGKDFVRLNNWFGHIGLDIPCLSSYDASKFIKRFRTYSLRDYEKRRKEDSTFTEKYNPTFRYFLIGEYGETLLRPHLHGLFYTNSEFIASNTRSLLSKSWKFGRIDFSFVSDSNSHYVAQYLNCTSHLPSIYRVKYTRPFFLCSKFPPIGTLCHSSQEIKKLFFECSPEQVIFNHRKSVFDNVPLWRTYIDRLYPRLSGFDSLSHSDRVTLYGVVSKRGFQNFATFRKWLMSDDYKPSLIKDYISYFKVNCNDFECAFQRWYYISSRVCKQAESFEISIYDYVRYIERFYENVKKKKLELMYEWQDEQKDVVKPSPLVGMDKLFIQSLFDLDVANVSNEELIILSSYGIDIDKFFSDDENIRISYQTSLLPENTWDYNCLSLDSESWLRSNMKTKRKNEYLDMHPDLKNILY